jgi:uncharacterized repeat protein (TIGR03803 family)
MKRRLASAISAVLALLLLSLTIYAPAARAQSWGEVVLHSFAGTDGESPYAGLIQSGDGNFYSATYGAGGTFPYGTVFQLTPSGTLTTLNSFHYTDGEWPRAGVIEGTDGNFYGSTSFGANKGPNGFGGGTVFKLTPSGILTTIYPFCSQANCSDGAEPSAGVIQGSDGNFYGTTYYGGANHSTNAPYGDGTVFQLTPSGTLTTLHSFCSNYIDYNCLDGGGPTSALIEANDGNFYGTTGFGGANRSAGTVFKITPSGTLTTLYSFCSVIDPSTGSCTDGQWPYAGLIQGSDGNFYGTTVWGGTNGGGNVFELTPSGTLTTVYSFCSISDPSKGNCLDGYYPYASVIEGSDGNFYGTTIWGGANGSFDGTAFKLTPSGTLTTLYSFCGEGSFCTDGDQPYAPLIQGSNGNLYGTTLGGGEDGFGAVFEIGPSLPTATPTATATATSSPTPKPTPTGKATPTARAIRVVPKELTLKAEPNTTASASITIENMGTGPILVGISAPEHNPPFSESPAGTFLTVPGENYQVTITYSPTNSTTSKQKSDSIAVKALTGDPNQKRPIDVKLKGKD